MEVLEPTLEIDQRRTEGICGVQLPGVRLRFGDSSVLLFQLAKRRFCLSQPLRCEPARIRRGLLVPDADESADHLNIRVVLQFWQSHGARKPRESDLVLLDMTRSLAHARGESSDLPGPVLIDPQQSLFRENGRGRSGRFLRIREIGP